MLALRFWKKTGFLKKTETSINFENKFDKFGCQRPEKTEGLFIIIFYSQLQNVFPFSLFCYFFLFHLFLTYDTYYSKFSKIQIILRLYLRNNATFKIQLKRK